MKLVIILFFCFKPISLQVDSFGQVGTIDKYIPIQKDVTRLELDLQKGLKVLNQVEPAPHDLLVSNAPVIRRAPLARSGYSELPIQSDGTKERAYAVLPETVSVPGAKKRLSDFLLLKRNGRKEDELYSENNR